MFYEQSSIFTLIMRNDSSNALIEQLENIQAAVHFPDMDTEEERILEDFVEDEILTDLRDKSLEQKQEFYTKMVRKCCELGLRLAESEHEEEVEEELEPKVQFVDDNGTANILYWIMMTSFAISYDTDLRKFTVNKIQEIANDYEGNYTP
ncbi:MAG: hypothetical protein A3F18_08575 [Legionellales bacterium RIFCSPHIGHO2_12_FULL_37_14]|nr:MAG: hypothetical protein A3F18_08575 [Legionellales bacterium RIFCSPHIGHO2_12_FULL_37_14]